MKNGVNCINILYAGSYRKIPMYQGRLVKKFKSFFKYICIELNKMKLIRVIQMCKNIFATKMVLIVLNFDVQNLTKYCRYIMFYV